MPETPPASSLESLRARSAFPSAFLPAQKLGSAMTTYCPCRINGSPIFPLTCNVHCGQGRYSALVMIRSLLRSGRLPPAPSTPSPIIACMSRPNTTTHAGASPFLASDAMLAGRVPARSHADPGGGGIHFKFRHLHQGSTRSIGRRAIRETRRAQKPLPPRLPILIHRRNSLKKRSLRPHE